MGKYKVAHLKSREIQLVKEVQQLREMKKKFWIAWRCWGKKRSLQYLEEEKQSVFHQLQLALARADSEALAKSIAEETVADLEKEKTMKELEIKDFIGKPGYGNVEIGSYKKFK